MHANLKIITWNALGIRNKALEFFTFLCKHDVDLALVSETWLSSNINLSNRSYKCYRYDRQDRTGGGVAMVVKRSIRHLLLPIVRTQIVENISIEIPFNNGSHLKIFFGVLSRPY